MKPTLMTRLGVIISALISALALAVTFISALDPAFFRDVAGRCDALLGNYGAFWRIVLALVCVGLLTFIILEAWYACVGRKSKEAPKPEPLPVSGEGDGSVMISPAAVESLVRRCVSPEDGIDNLDVSVTSVAEGLDIQMEAAVRQGVNIQEMAKALQEKVSNSLEVMTGLKLQGVRFLVRDIEAEEKK